MQTLAVDTDERAMRGVGCARRRRERRLRSALRHEQQWPSALPSTTARTETRRRKWRRCSCTTCHGTSCYRRSRCSQAFGLWLWVKCCLWTRSRNTLWETWTPSCCLFHMFWCRLTMCTVPRWFVSSCSKVWCSIVLLLS